MVSPKRSGAASPPATDPLEAALQAGSEALVELQLIQTVRHGHALHAHLVAAIDALRSTLAEVRIAQGAHHSPLGYGFIACSEELVDPNT